MADVASVNTAAPAGGEHKYVFNVTMSCGGCSGAVERVLKKLEGASPVLSTRFPTPSTLPTSPTSSDSLPNTSPVTPSVVYNSEHI